MNEQEFRKKLDDVGTKPEEVSVLLPKERFKNNLKDEEIPLKQIMFLGLNRSEPRAEDKAFHNMHERIDFLLEDAELWACVEGAYLTDFFKWGILNKYHIPEESLSSSKEVLKAIKNTNKEKEIKEECRKILTNEIDTFKITTVFCWGWEGGYKSIREYSDTKECKSKGRKMFRSNERDFIYLLHYSNRFKKEKEKIIINQIKSYLQKISKIPEGFEVII